MRAHRRPAVLGRYLVAGCAAVAAGTAIMVSPGSATAAPVGKVDAGVPFSSVVYGTGCRYDLTVDVNSVGTVAFWEKPQGAPARFLGAAEADGAIATIRWVPRRVATTELYATQNGVTGPSAVLRVHQGHGSGWACFAL